MQGIEKFEDSLWAAADNLRANSGLTSSEYCMPVLGIIFLRHATNRYEAASLQITEDQVAGRMPKRARVKGDFLKRRALMLPNEARYDSLLRLPKDANLGEALVEAMDAIERDFEPLAGQLPKDYEKFNNNLLEELLRVFDSATLRTASGDVFGRIYEYFLMKTQADSLLRAPGALAALPIPGSEVRPRARPLPYRHQRRNRSRRLEPDARPLRRRRARGSR